MPFQAISYCASLLPGKALPVRPRPRLPVIIGRRNRHDWRWARETAPAQFSRPYRTEQAARRGARDTLLQEVRRQRQAAFAGVRAVRKRGPKGTR